MPGRDTKKTLKDLQNGTQTCDAIVESNAQFGEKQI